MRMVGLFLVVIATIMTDVNCDLYLHNPRGSNNRLDEKSGNRRNNNRMFDSQNNNHGGYNVGDRYSNPAEQGDRNSKEKRQYQPFYIQSGPKVSDGIGASHYKIEWTNQHGCGGNEDTAPNKLNCQLVIQYMCQPDNDRSIPYPEKIKDGISTDTISYRPPSGNEDASRFARRKADITRSLRGLQEPVENYDKCITRERNKGLFNADQKLNGNSAKYTRQNPNGQRSGLECPEERDHYPYWHPSDWKDIVIMAENQTMCSYYQSESFNVKPKHECIERLHYGKPNNEAACKAAGGKWQEVNNYLEKLKKSDGSTPTSAKECNDIAAAIGAKSGKTPKVKFARALYGTKDECLVELEKPDCRGSPFSRVNHLGNGGDNPLEQLSYDWKLPHFPSGSPQRCFLRFRYNITTDDYDPYNTDASLNGKEKSPITQNPYVDVGAGDVKLRLAINTAQTGRIFEDRSFMFRLYGRPSSLANTNIYNLNVRGKRGNIVQTYPGTEYDFTPNELKVKKNDMIHIQWTGSNTHNNQNPTGDGQPGDEGQGKGGSDRSNILSMSDTENNFFVPLENRTNLAHNLDVLWSAKRVPGMTPLDTGVQLASAGFYACVKCSRKDSLSGKYTMDKQMNNAPASFPGMLVRPKNEGVFPYGCSRNNNHSNRSQKAKIIVSK